MKTTLIYRSLLLLALVACQKTPSLTNAPADIRYPATAAEKTTVATLLEVASVLREVYKDPNALREVNAAVYSHYYEDESVLLNDLLHPETSALYQSTAFQSFGITTRHFKQQFFAEMKTGHYPLLKEALAADTGRLASDSDQRLHTSTTGTLTTNGTAATGRSLFSRISIYFPFSDHFRPAFTANQTSSVTGATVVGADREADEAPGQRPYRCGSGVCYKPVAVDDLYCENNLTHIVTTGTGRLSMTQATTTPPAPHLVLLGQVRCTKQYDKLISFTGNGGGSELQFIRGDAFLKQNAEGQITNPENTISVSCSRAGIRKKKWLTINSIWDSNWEPDNKEQVFGIYEEDTEGSGTFSGSIQTKLKSLTIEPFGYEFTVKTKDEIIRQLGWNRESFYAYNNGQLRNSCGVSGGWTIYDCNTPVAYTLPQQ